MWQFIPRLPDAYSWATRSYGRYSTLDDITTAIQQKDAKCGGILEVVHTSPTLPSISELQWHDGSVLYTPFRNTMELKKCIETCSRKGLTVRCIYMYDVGYFIK
jgi:hypothetical protein